MRKQTAEKHASKCLVSIRKLLQAYALARPNVRLSMRVLKAKNGNLDFNYAPKTSGATVHDAAFKVVGTEPASQCSWAVFEAGRFEVQALLPSSDAPGAKINGVGHFISVDRRPISTSRGFLKQIAKRVIERLRCSRDERCSVSNPFFVLNITCSRGSYDPNMEPAKDDVIFDNEAEVSAAVDELLSRVYPNRLSTDNAEEILANGVHTPRAPSEDVPLIEKEIRPLHPLMPHQHVEYETETQSERRLNVEDGHGVGDDMLFITKECDVPEANADIWRSSMYGCDEEDLGLFERDQMPKHIIDDGENQKDEKNGLNPWSIAKLNALVKPRVAVSRDSNYNTSVNPEIRRLKHNTGLSPLISQGSVNEGAPPANHPANGTAQQKKQSELLLSLTTPPPSSSLTRGTQLSHQASKLPRRRIERDQSVVKPFVRPLCRRKSEDDYISGRARKARSLRKPQNEGRDLLEIWSDTVEPTHMMNLKSREESTERRPSDEQIEDAFRAQLRRAAEDLTSLRTSRVLARGTDIEQPLHVVTSHSSGWTPINTAAQGLVPQDIPSTTTKRRRTTESKRQKTSRLSLELVPGGFQTHNLLQVISLSPSDLKSLVHIFGYADPAALLDHSLHDTLPMSMLSTMCVEAVGLLQEQLRKAESSANEEVALAFVGTFSRLGRAEVVGSTS